jgi:hypothetical protein
VDRVHFEPWKPWEGKEFNTTKLLILSESAYSWRDDEGNEVSLLPEHPKFQLHHWGIDHFGEQKYYTALGRALCGTMTPSPDELEKTWNEYAYSIFVQGSVGLGAKSRPTKKQLQNSGPYFLRLIEELRPLKVVVTGKTTWNNMPDWNGPYLCNDLGAYKLSDGTLVWCLGVPHPGNRDKGGGFQWESVGVRTRAFRSIGLPLRES